MSNIMFLLFTYISEAFIAFIYAKHIYKPKKNKYHSLLLTIILYIILMLIYNFLFNNGILNLVLITIVDFIVIYCLFESSLKSAFFHTIILTILQIVSEFLTVYIFSIVYNLTAENSIENHFQFEVILSKILYFALSVILSKISAKETNSKSWGKWCILSLLPLCSIFIVFVLKSITDSIQLTAFQNIICLASAALLLIVNIVIYVVYEQSEQSSQKLIELEIINQKSEIDLKYLALLEKKNEQMQIMAHDYKNHILTIESMSKSPEIKNYIESMIGEISQYSNIGKTKNKILDVILSKYNYICAEKMIKFNTEIISDNLSSLKPVDLSSLFNNLLDNSVEAAELSQNKYINLYIANVTNSYHKITLINSCDTEPNSRSGKLLTSKSNKTAHGFGTKSINKIVESYNGEIKWKYNPDNREFIVTIYIPVEQ